MCCYASKLQSTLYLDLQFQMWALWKFSQMSQGQRVQEGPYSLLYFTQYEPLHIYRITLTTL